MKMSNGRTKRGGGGVGGTGAEAIRPFSRPMRVGVVVWIRT